MNKIAKITLIIAILIIGIAMAFFLKGKYTDYLINSNAGYLKSYEQLYAAGYEEITEENFIDVVQDYVEDTNIQTDRLLFKKVANEDIIEYFMAVGTEKVPQVLVKLQTNPSNLSTIDFANGTDAIKEALSGMSGDKYVLSVFTGDNVTKNGNSVSDVFTEYTFTLKSLVGGGVSVENFSSEGCSKGMLDFTDQSGGAYTESSASCKEIFNTTHFDDFLTKLFTGE